MYLKIRVGDEAFAVQSIKPHSDQQLQMLRPYNDIEISTRSMRLPSAARRYCYQIS